MPKGLPKGFFKRLTNLDVQNKGLRLTISLALICLALLGAFFSFFIGITLALAGAPRGVVQLSVPAVWLVAAMCGWWGMKNLSAGRAVKTWLAICFIILTVVAVLAGGAYMFGLMVGDYN